MIWNKIPQELKQNGLWCCWRLTDKGKLPFDARTGKMARANDPSTFTSFVTALENVSKYYTFDENGRPMGGLGLGVFNGYSAIDIDGCIEEDGKLSPLAVDVVEFCASYTEISPSGKGIRIILKTETPLNKDTHYVNNRKLGLEIYLSDQTNKYVTITGEVIRPYEIREVDISYILEKYMQKSGSVSTPTAQTFSIEDFPHDKKLNELWFQKAPGSGSNESELDLALCNKLAFYLKGDFVAINNAFVSSPYYQSKDKEHKKKWEVRGDYREMTIKRSIEAVGSLNAGPGSMTLTDTGNARRLVQAYGDQIRYNVDNKRWMFYNGAFWQTDVFGNIKNYAEVVVEEMRQKAKTIEDEEVRKAMAHNVKRALQSSGKTAMIKEAEHLKGMPVTNNDFDADPFLFNLKNGTLNLKTGKLSSHKKERMISRYSPYDIASGKPERWLRFLNEIFDGDDQVIRYVQRIMGYSMTGSAREQCMFMLIGDGSNGKSLLLDIMNEAFGSYSATSNVDILLEKRNSSSGNLGDVARLQGVRHVVTDEAKLGDKLNESAIKTMTSGIGKIVARFLYGNEFEFTMLSKIFMASNYKPVIRGTDHGIWRRIKVIPFRVVIPDDKQDKDLKLKLIEEIPKILGWMLEGCLEWQRIGLGPPDSINDETQEYRSEMDVVQRWLKETCMLGPGYRTPSSELFRNFSNYVQANKEFQLSHTMFGRNMAKKFPKRVYGGTTYYLGLKLKEDNEYRHDPELYNKI